MAEFPALPVWTDAYMLDCGHLSDAEHGRYFLLLMLIWRSPECRIPNEADWIARKLKRSIGEFESDIVPLIKEFCKTTGNWVTQKRLTREFLYLQNKSKSQSVRAKLRWDKEKVSYRGDAPTPTPIYKGKPPVLKEVRKDTMAGSIALDENSEAFKAWEAYTRATTGRGCPRTTIRPEGARPYTGWYFKTEWPPNLMKRTA